eukprot:CAMPEP_0118878002 /NCGR_PEP_ID=MMETSP1163-20130328/18085_1 /TAXON_ID=124430 /ORGANISM="Phaeomonas parva, Strain CCMP2877" /LENGTH=41 /DNA_ID= /DNA_START= /DNA_END= /DNA_ORIENTATION=
MRLLLLLGAAAGVGAWAPPRALRAGRLAGQRSSLHQHRAVA